jgi:hypothetical protein
VIIIQVTGSRFWRSPETIADALDETAYGHDEVLVRHGMCPPRWVNNSYVSWETALKIKQGPRSRELRGADWLADRHATDRGWRVEAYPADWTRWGVRAGGVRNQEMVDLIPKADIVLAFLHPQSSGTRDCLRRAKRARIPDRKFYEDEERGDAE